MYPGKHIVVWVGSRKRPIFGIVVALILAFWLGTQYENGWRILGPKTSAQPISFEDLIPCTFAPANGDVLVRNVQIWQPGHSIEIDNGSTGNAIVKLLDADTRRVAVSFFVAANQTASYDYLPDGRYLVQYAFGDQLNQTCRAFAHTTAASEFPSIDTMAARPTQTGVILSTVTYTLYNVPSGNIRPKSINPRDFDAE